MVSWTLVSTGVQSSDTTSTASQIDSTETAEQFDIECNTFVCIFISLFYLSCFISACVYCIGLFIQCQPIGCPK